MNFNLHINKILLETSDWTGSIVKWTEPSDGNEYVIMTDHGDSVDIVNTSYFVRSKQPPPRGYWLRQIPKSFFTVVTKANDSVRQSTNEVYPHTPGDPNNRPAAKADSPMGATVYHYDAPKDNPAKAMSPYTVLFLALLDASLFGKNNAINYYKSLPPQSQEMIKADILSYLYTSDSGNDELAEILRYLEKPSNEGTRPAGWPNKKAGDPVTQKRKPRGVGKSFKYRKNKSKPSERPRDAEDIE